MPTNRFFAIVAAVALAAPAAPAAAAEAPQPEQTTTTQAEAADMIAIELPADETADWPGNSSVNAACAFR
ncbi:hypothetical protein ACN27F_08885 [Solwaraspora sp. WMMB335]|uniref:hypothetical protein n=1 Tax=Solwaraspora sp. WMMB335 TaxID=3404118 RepID=UPI003B927C8E